MSGADRVMKRRKDKKVDRSPVDELVDINWVEDDNEEEITGVPWSKPDMGQRERTAVWDVMTSGWVTMGEQYHKLQEDLQRFLKVDHCVLFDHGTSSLLAALIAHQAKVVVIPSYTFQATLNAVAFSGAYPQFADVDPMSVHMQPDRSLEEDGHYFVPVSYAGLALDPWVWDGKPVIEDGAEAFGASKEDILTGSQGWTTIFSFHAAKLVSMIEGGAVVTNDDNVARRLQEFRNNGESLEEKWKFLRPGLNLKPTDVNAAIGRIQLRRHEEFLEDRFRASCLYEKELYNIDEVEFQAVPDVEFRHANMMMPIFVEDPRGLAEHLATKNIGTRLGWTPLADTPGAVEVSKKIICLPIFNGITRRQVEYVNQACLEFFGYVDEEEPAEEPIAEEPADE